jgi:hypothetical protein
MLDKEWDKHSSLFRSREDKFCKIGTVFRKQFLVTTLFLTKLKKTTGLETGFFNINFRLGQKLLLLGKLVAH